jgi:hypothetical protein
MRDVAVRNLAGLVARSLKGEGPVATVTGLSRHLERLAIPYGRENRRARLLHGLLRLLFLRGKQ